MIYTYWKWDKAVPKAVCEAISSNVDWDKKLNAVINDVNNTAVVNSKIRKTDVVFQDSLSTVACILDRYIRAANISANWGFDITFAEDTQIGKYCKGGFYDWHNDENILSGNSHQRKLSAVMLLSDTSEFKGGKLEFKDIDDQPVLEQGSVIVFPSFIKHRVTPVTKGERISAVSWMHGPKFK